MLEFFKKRLMVSKIDKKYPKIVKQNSKPVIGLVVTTFDKGGLEQVVLNLYLGYKKAGYKTFLLCQENILGIMANSIEPKDLYVFNNDKNKFLQLLYDENITILHYHYNIFAADIVKKIGIKTIYTMHNVYTWKNDQEIIEYNDILKSMDKIVPVSNLVKNYYIARTNAQEEKFKVIYNGIDFAELSSNMLPDNITRNALGLNDDDIVLAFVASFYPVKYQIGMIGVMEEVVKYNQNIKLLFVGNTENEYYKTFFNIYSESLAKENMLRVPYFEHKYMGEFLRQVVDVFILPTLQEGCSNAVLEAIYCDKPMILTNVGNAMDVEYLKSCIVVNAAYEDIIKTTNDDIIRISSQKNGKNRDELKEAILTVADNLSLYKSNAVISETEKIKFETSYMVDQYIKIIEDLDSDE